MYRSKGVSLWTRLRSKAAIAFQALLSLGQRSPKTSRKRARYSGMKAKRASIMSASPLPETAPLAALGAWTSSDLAAPTQNSLP